MTAVATIRSYDTNLLTPQERCDRCNAQAFIKATMPGGFDLLFCAHHFGDAHDKLVGTEGVEIDDYSPALEVEVQEARRRLGSS